VDNIVSDSKWPHLIRFLCIVRYSLSPSRVAAAWLISARLPKFTVARYVNSLHFLVWSWRAVRFADPIPDTDSVDSGRVVGADSR
jgi:hypothetical protein